jgi:hypothetical protein
MFYTKKWKICYICEISGNYKDVQIIFRNLPCKIDTSNNKKKYPDDEFSCELYEAVISQLLDDFPCVKRRIESDCIIKETIILKNYQNIEAELISDNVIDRKDFYYNVGEAIIDAFSKAGIKM